MNYDDEYEFTDEYCEKESKKYATSKIALVVSPYEFELLMAGVGTVISDYEGPWDVGDYKILREQMESIKKEIKR